ARATALGVTRVVDDDGRASSVSCDAANPAPRTIQEAIDLSDSGDIILVCPGVYEEQLKIVSKALTIRGVTSGVLNQVLIRPSGVVANSTNAFSGDPVAAVIAIEDSVNVILRNLTIDGGDNRLTDCAPTLVGVFYRAIHRARRSPSRYETSGSAPRLEAARADTAFSRRAVAVASRS